MKLFIQRVGECDDRNLQEKVNGVGGAGKITIANIGKDQSATYYDDAK